MRSAGAVKRNEMIIKEGTIALLTKIKKCRSLTEDLHFFLAVSRYRYLDLE